MKIRPFITGCVLAVVCLVHVTGELNAGEQAWLADPSFERQLPADEGGWRLFEISQFSRNHARTGTHAIFHGGFSRSVPHHPYFIGHASGAYQEFPASPGSRWRLTGYGLAPEPLRGNPAFGILQLSFFDASGNDLGTVETAGLATFARTSNQVDGRSAVGEWLRLDTGVATAPEGAVSVQAFTLYVDYSGKGIMQGVYFDDLTLCLLADDEDGSSPCGED